VGNGRLLTVAEVAERLNVGESYVRRLVFERRVPFTKLGHRTLRIAEDDVEAFVHAGRIEPSDSARTDRQRGT
jgi:excisionase family DNA binding protein